MKIKQSCLFLPIRFINSFFIGVYVMLTRRLLGYLYLILGFLCIIFFAREFLQQLIAIIVGVSLIVKGFRELAVERAVYHYSQMYFNDQFRK